MLVIQLNYRFWNWLKKIIVTGRANKITFLSLPEDDPTKRKPDISKAQKLIGWEPEIALDDRLIKTTKYFADTPAEINSISALG